MDDEQIRLILQIVGDDKLDGLTARLKRARDELKTTGTTAKQSEKQIYDFADSYEVLTTNTRSAAAVQHAMAMAERQAAREAAIAAQEERKLGDALRSLAKDEEVAAASAEHLAMRQAQAMQWLTQFSATVPQAAARIGHAQVVLAGAGTGVRQLGDAATRAAGARGSGGMGLLFLGQAVDDMQYGFRAVVNQIPQLVMAVGGSAGLAGAAVIAGVGINMMIQRLDLMKDALREIPSLSSVLGGSGGMSGLLGDLESVTKLLETAKDRTIALVATGGDVFGGSGELITGATKNREMYERQKATEAKRARDVEQAHKTVEAIEHADDKKGGETIRKAIEKTVGGGTHVSEAFFQKELTKHPELKGDSSKAVEGRQKLRDNIDLAITNAMKGQSGAIKEFDRMAEGTTVATPLAKARVEAWKEANAAKVQAEQEHARRAEQEIDDLNEQARDNQEVMLKELSTTAMKGVQDRYGKTFSNMLIAEKAAGISVEDQVRDLTMRVGTEMKRLNPLLAKFPDAFKDAVGQVVQGIRDNVEKAVAELADAEGLIKTEAVRRLDMRRRAQQESNLSGRALDEFTQTALSQNARQRRRNPHIPEMTTTQAEQVAKSRQEHLTSIGLSAEQQVRISKVGNNAALAPRADALFQSLLAQGVDERTAYEQALAIAESHPGGFNVGAMTGRALNRIMRGGAADFNRGAMGGQAAGGSQRDRVRRARAAGAGPQPRGGNVAERLKIAQAVMADQAAREQFEGAFEGDRVAGVIADVDAKTAARRAAIEPMMAKGAQIQAAQAARAALLRNADPSMRGVDAAPAGGRVDETSRHLNEIKTESRRQTALLERIVGGVPLRLK